MCYVFLLIITYTYDHFMIAIQCITMCYPFPVIRTECASQLQPTQHFPNNQREKALARIFFAAPADHRPTGHLMGLFTYKKRA